MRNIYEFQGFDSVKQVFTFILTISLFLSISAFGQGGAGPVAIPLSFPDSVVAALEKTRKPEALLAASEFGNAWASLGLDQQQTVRNHFREMKKKKFSFTTHYIKYLRALSNAVTIERIDAAKLNQYLGFCGKIIEFYPPAQALKTFENLRVFFEHHALYVEKFYRLNVQNDSYSFEFIEPAPTISWDDIEEEPTTEDTWPEEETSWSDEEEYADEPVTEIPSWMNPPPQPFLEGALIRFDRVTLNIATPSDSVFLKNTKGAFSLKDDLFVGQDGTFDWTPAGLPDDVVSCSLGEYNFNVRKAEFKADLVKLNYVGKTPGFIPGKMQFKSVPRKDSVLSPYPQFQSYQSDLKITGMGNENIRYSGGFSLIGNKISSRSVLSDFSKIDVYSNGQKKFTAHSPEFIFKDSTVSSEKARVTIYQDNDSITHPSVRLRYKANNEEALFLSAKGAMRNAPYSSSFFNMDFSANIVQWNLTKDSLDILTDGGRSTMPMILESIDFYDPNDFRLLKGNEFSFHPLALVVNYCEKMKVREFYSGDLGTYARKDQREIKAAIEFLALKGMINYNAKTDIVFVPEKSINFFKSFKGEMDYDNLKIHSVTDLYPNATVNFQKREMTVRGVEEFKLSDSLNVKIEPDSSIITILQNRDIKFDGTISAGNFEISGKGFTLNYDSFFVNLTHIDSINFFVTEKNARGQSIRRKINNSMVGADSIAAAEGDLGDISKSSGTLYISRSNNKSGKVKIPTYPRLDATTGGVIYFDRREVLNGAYDRSIFFVIPPFKLDSLNDADPTSINFDGKFISSGMFPSFKEKLMTMPDKSLGFDHAIPKGGYQLFKGDGKLEGVISMNNRGLRATGKIDFLAATVVSPDFVFYPDSVLGKGNRATIREQQFGSVLFPQASLPDFEMQWYPKEDEMVLTNLRAPFNFYDSTAQLSGNITISKEGVAGSGVLLTRGTEVVSEEMKFNGKDLGARHAEFKVNTGDPNKPLMAGRDIRLKFDLDDNYADISPEIEGEAAIEFPYAQFKTSIPDARWDLGEQKIHMTKRPDVPIENSYFYTTRKDLDSLRFNAEAAEYDIQTQQLKVSGIPYIIVADAKITPENNEVLILENARIGTLKNTTILLDTLNGYHRLTEGVVDVISRKEFSGYATYQYVNFLNDTFAIKMTDFHLEPIEQTETHRRKRSGILATHQTVAVGAVVDADNLVLGAGMYYKGDMTMYATRPALQLKGFVKLDIKKIKNYNTWIRYEQTGEETEVLIDFNKAMTELGKRADAGLHFSYTDNSLYISFLNDKRNEDDDNFFVPSGTLHYDPELKEYKIEDLEKAAGNKLSGKLFAYNDETSQVRFEGETTFFRGNKDFSVRASALGSGNLETNEIRLNSFLMVDTNVPGTALDVMARNLQEVIKNEGADEGLGDQTELLYKIADILGERAVKDFEEKSFQGYVPLATLSATAKPLVFANVSLKWSQGHKAFYSEGALGMSNINRNDINGAFEGFMELRKNEDGSPVFHVFFKASPDAWYYFGFEDNRLLVQSSNKDFNNIISKRTNAGKAKIGEVAFLPGSDEETLAFINRFRKNYYGIEVPYNLYAGSSAAKKKEEKEKVDDDGF